MSELITLSPGVYRRERAYQDQLGTLQGVLWQQGSSSSSGEISIASAVAAHRAQHRWLEQQEQVQSIASNIVALTPVRLTHPELDTLQHQALWLASLPAHLGTLLTAEASSQVAEAPSKTLIVAASAQSKAIPARHSALMALWILAFDAYAQLHVAATTTLQLGSQTTGNLLQTVVGTSLEWKHAQERALQHQLWLQQRQLRRTQRSWKRFTYTQKLSLHAQQAALARAVRLGREHLVQTVATQKSALDTTLQTQQTRVQSSVQEVRAYARGQYTAVTRIPTDILSTAKTTRQNLSAAAQDIWEWSEPAIAALSHVVSVLSLSVAVALFLLFASPIVILEGQSAIQRAQAQWWPGNKPHVVAQAPEASTQPQPSVTSAEDLFSLSIPDLGIHSTITANVDATNPTAYEHALKTGIAHAQGTALPDEFRENKTMYLFAHSTNAVWNIQRYNAQFYALKDAKLGSTITIRFWGQDYTYIITDRLIVAADDTSYLQPQTDESRLVLQTCYPPGTVDKRLIVIAKPQ